MKSFDVSSRLQHIDSFAACISNTDEARYFRIVAFVLIVFLGMPNRSAMGMSPYAEFSEISHTADVIFVGTVTDISCRIQGVRMVFTDVTFDEIDLISRKEHVPVNVEDSIMLTFGGGRAGGISISVSGVPKFELGQRCLIFALHDGRVYDNPLVGEEQGLFRLTTDPQTGKIYPLAEGKCGIVSVNNGRLKKLSRVNGISNGRIQRFPRRKRMMSAPRSSGRSPIAISAKEPPQPDRLLSLEEFIKDIYVTLAAPPPANSVFSMKNRIEVPDYIYPDPEERSNRQHGLVQPTPSRKGLVPKGPQFQFDQNDVLSTIDQPTGNNTLYPLESASSEEESALAEGIVFGYCGAADLPFVFEQYPVSWSPWYEINQNCMWLFNQFMGIYEYVPSDGSVGDNDDNEFCGFITSAQKNRLYGTDWGRGVMGACRTSEPWYSTCDCCEIVQADIMFNPSYAWGVNLDNTLNTGKLLYRQILMHEMGHSWGLMRGNLTEKPYTYDELTIMHRWYRDIVEDGYGIHAADAWAIRGAYQNQTFIRGFHDMGVESYYADAGLHSSTTDKRIYAVGETMRIERLTVESMSHTVTSDVRLSIYLSTDNNITTSDIKLGDDTTWSLFTGESAWRGTVPRVIPDTVPPGVYYVGAIVYAANDDYPLNNATYLNQTIEVTCPEPSRPQGLTATEETYSDRVRLTWNNAEGIADYEVWRNTTASTLTTKRIASGVNGQYYNDFTAIPGTSHYYRIKARNNCGSVSGFSDPDVGYRAQTDGCKIPPNYDRTIIPSLERQTIQEGFHVQGCHIYRMYLYTDVGYDFSVCSKDGMGGWFSSDGDGDLTMFNSAGNQMWYIRGYTSCGYDATTIGVPGYSNWSPPADGNYYLKVSEHGDNQPAGYKLAYRATSGDRCRQAPSYDRTLAPEPYWQVTDSHRMIAGACRTYRIFMLAGSKYDFTLCSSDDVGASWSSYTDGDLYLYNSAGDQVIHIDGEAGCRYDASTLGTIYEGLNPPSDDYYYLKVATHSPGFDATFRLAYKACRTPAAPATSQPLNESSDVSPNTNLVWLGILDDFDRPFNSYMGKSWTEHSGDLRISANTARGNNNSVMIFNGAVGNHISVQAHKIGSELGHVALISGYADLDNCIFITIQGEEAYDKAFFYIGQHGTNNSAWPGQTLFNLSPTFTSASISTHLEGDKVTLLIDTNFDGIADQRYTRDGVPLHLLGDGIGLGVYGIDSMDNFALTGPIDSDVPISQDYGTEQTLICHDFAYPLGKASVGDLGSVDRAIAVDIEQTAEVSSLAIRAVIGFKTNLTVKIREVNGTTLGPVQASATTRVPAGPLDFYEVPINFTFHADLRYDISFNVTGGWGKNGNDQLEYYSFNNHTLAPANGFIVGSFRVLDGRGKSYSDIYLPHVRVCLAQPCQTTWDLYFSTENPPETLLASNLTQPACDPTPVPNKVLESCTTYYWRTVLKNCCGQVEGPVWSFTTGETLPYDPYPQDGDQDVSVHSSLIWRSAASVGGSDEPVEILSNPGFESGQLSPWYTGANGTWGVFDSYLHSGNYNAQSRDASWIQQDFQPVAVADINTVSLWSRQPGKNRKTAVEFYYQDGSSNYVLKSTSGTWRLFDVTSGLQENKFLTGLRIWNFGADGIDDLINIDDVSIIAEVLPCQTTYNVYMGTKSPPHALVASGLTEPAFDPTPQIGDMLNSCDRYYWQVESNNCCGQTLTGPIWTFKTAQIGDLNGTRTVSLEDFAAFARHWLEIDCAVTGWCDASDIDHSGGNDYTDLSLLLEQWLRTCP